MIIALVTAGGIGKRIQTAIPKQFIKIKNKPLLIYTLEKFQYNENIDSIIVACLEEWIDHLEKLLLEYNITKVKWIVKNGRTQPESIKNCINKLEKVCKKDDIIVIHAGNRPLINDEIINMTIIECKETGSGISAVSCPEVLINKDTNEIIDRESTLKIQTPQTFLYSKLKENYDKLGNFDVNEISTTSDLMIKCNEKVSFVEGSHLNFKITYPEDLKLFECLLK